MGGVMRTAVADIDNTAVATCGIAVMAKASIAGRSKTRLVPPLTFEQAAQCNTAFLRDIADSILAAAAQASIAGYIAYGPADARPFFQANLPPEITLIEACYPTLGECLDYTIAQLLERCPRRFWSKPPTCLRSPATGQCSGPPSTAATTCSA